MRKRFITMLCAACAVFAMCLCGLVGCGLFGDDEDEQKDTTPKTYTVQYTDDDGVHQLTVTAGMPYSIETVPQKTGYSFTGLFDAESGGTQYIAANGSSLTAFNDGRNLVLFPQFKANEYTVILDYGVGEVTGERSFTVSYGQSLPTLPKNVTADHMIFNGWCTEADGGVMVADKNGLIPLVSVVNENNFDITAENITLYAKFEYEKYDVTMYFGDGIDPEVKQFEYGTTASRIISNTRVDGKAPLLWSETDGGDTYTGVLQGPITLYAKEYAPVIDFDCDGGAGVIPVVARSGEHIDLPTPVKSLCAFVYWQDENGDEYTSRIMPTDGITLKAIWRAKISFDENGGSGVEDISVESGEQIALPVPEKEGYIFAGWYTADKTRYTATVMPSVGVDLKAGWYKAEIKTIVLIENNFNSRVIVDSNTLAKSRRFAIDLSDIFPTIPAGGVNIVFTVNFKWGNTSQGVLANGQLALYEGDELSSNNELKKIVLAHGTDHTAYESGSMKGAVTVNDNMLYLYYAGAGKLHISLSGGYGDKVAFYDVNLELLYPNTSKLYL